jgi:hypothetical protein
MEGSKEDVEAVRAFFQTCAPEASATRCWWSVTSAGIIRAIADCFRDRRASAAWRIDRNPPPRVPTDLRPEFKTCVSACYQAPSRAIARSWRPTSAPTAPTSAAGPVIPVPCFQHGSSPTAF